MMAVRLILAMLFAAPHLSAQILKVAEMTTEEIGRIDRARTAVILPGGVLEQHGPYLPSFTDGYMNEWWTERLAEAVVARPGWTALVFPMLPLGVGGANEIGGKFVFPGTYGVRFTTLRAVYMDLAGELGEQGFRWVFIVQNHGSPLHNLALDQAGDYFRDAYGGHMVNLCGLMPEDATPEPSLSGEAAIANGLDIHAGASETSRMIFVRPNLVAASVAAAKPHPGHSFSELVGIARQPDWPGYFGAPGLATASFGAAVMRYRADLYIRMALQVLDGRDEREVARFSTEAIADEKEGVAAALAHDEMILQKQAEWLRSRGGQ